MQLVTYRVVATKPVVVVTNSLGIAYSPNQIFEGNPRNPSIVSLEALGYIARVATSVTPSPSVDLSSLPPAPGLGPVGPQGPEGPEGPQGPPGADGVSAAEFAGYRLIYFDGNSVAVTEGTGAINSGFVSAATMINFNSDGVLGMDTKTLAGTGELSAGVVTKSGTSFDYEQFFYEYGVLDLYAFSPAMALDQWPIITTNGGLTHTVPGLWRLPPSWFIRPGDLIGHQYAPSPSFVRVTAVDGYVITTAEALNFGGQSLTVVQAPTIDVGGVKTTVIAIDSATQLRVSDAVSTVAPGATMTAGVRATSGNDLARLYAVYVVEGDENSPTFIASTRRDAPWYTALPPDNYVRDFIGWVKTHTDGSIINFIQTGVGRTRCYRYPGGETPDFLDIGGVSGVDLEILI